MKRKPSVEHLEDAVILAYLDGELSRAAAQKTKYHLQSCWKCRSTAAEIELLAETAYALLTGRDEADSIETGTAKADFLRRKVEIDETWRKDLRRRTSMLFQRPFSLIGGVCLRISCSPIYRSRRVRLFGLSRCSGHLQ